MRPRARRASELSHRGDVNIYLIDPERLNLDSVQEAVNDLYPGEEVVLHQLFTDKVNLSHIIQHNAEVKRQLIGFDPAKDRFIVVGRSMANFLAGWVVGLMGISEITLLVYLFQSRTYEEMTISAGERVASG